MQRWTATRNLQRCLCCGSHVTPEFRRGYGDQRDRAHRCRECDIDKRIARGSAAGLEVDDTDPLEDPGRFDGSLSDKPPQVRALVRGVTADGGGSA